MGPVSSTECLICDSRACNVPDDFATAQTSNIFGFQDVREMHQRTPLMVFGAIPFWLKGTFYHQAGGAFVSSLRFGSTVPHIEDGLAHVVALHLETHSPCFSNRFIDSPHYRAYCSRASTNVVSVPKLSPVASRNYNVGFMRTSKGVHCVGNYFGNSAVLLSNDLASVEENGILSHGDEIEDQDFGLILLAQHYYEAVDERLGRGAVRVGWNLRRATDYSFGNEYEARYCLYRELFPHSSSTHHLEVLSTLPVGDSFTASEASGLRNVDKLSFLHAVGETTNYVIVPCGSLKLEVNRLFSSETKPLSMSAKQIRSLFDYKPFEPLNFLVFRAEDGELVASLSTGTRGIITDFVNAYEDDDGRKIVVDVCWSEANPRANTSESGVRRFVLPLPHEETMGDEHRLHARTESDGYVQFKVLTSGGTDIVTMNPRYYRRPYRYFYSLDAPSLAERNHLLGNSHGIYVWTILKTEVNDKIHVATTTVWYKKSEDKLLSASDPVFVPRPDGTDEDDGVLLFCALDYASLRSWFIILDAKSMKEVARMQTPITVNWGLQSLFVPSNDNYSLKF